jgi:hypothetical protein
MKTWLNIILMAALFGVAVWSFRPTKVDWATGVISPCGFYAVITHNTRGDVELYDKDRPLPANIAADILELERGQRHEVLVPCVQPQNDNSFQISNR